MIPISDPYLITFINIVLVGLLTIILLFYRYIFPKKPINLFLLLIIISIVPIISIFRPGMYRSGDMRTHLPYLMGFYQSIHEGNMLPLWMGETCGKYGCPVFEFEYILPYYVGSLLHLIGFSFLTSVKMLLALPFIASGITMYLWAKSEFGKIPGFAAALLYLFAPYHLLVVHFKGSVGEVFAFVFIPLLFLFGKKLIETNNKIFFFLLALSFFCLLLSNSSLTIASAPIAVGYGIIVWYNKIKRSSRDLILFFASFLYGFMLASFYWMPALFEVKYTWLRFINYGSFIPIILYLYSPTYLGFLNQGHHGEYHQIIGYPHLLGVIAATILLFQKRIEKKLRLLLAYFLCSFIFLFFMFFPMSKPVWDNITLLHSFIGQTRLLTPIAIITAAIFAILIRKIKNPFFIMLICYLIIATTVLNWANRKMIPPPADPITNDSEIYTEYYNQDNDTSLQRYHTRLRLEGNVLSHPPSQPLEFIKGNGSYVQIKRQQEEHQYVIYVRTDAGIMENTFYFPGWTVFANGKAIPVNYENTTNDSFGKITFQLKKGLYKIDVFLLDTPIRSLAKNISLVTLLGGILTIIVFLSRNSVGSLKKRRSKELS
jgi:hypothetical protein